MNVIFHKVVSNKLFNTLDEHIILQNKWNLKKLYVSHPELFATFYNGKGKKVCKIGSCGKERRLTTSIFNLENLFEENDGGDSFKILGLVSNKRCYKFIKKEYIDQTHENINKWKVILPKSNGSGLLGEVLSTPIVGKPYIGFTQSFISVGAFESKYEAASLLKYIKSKFVRVLLGVLKITQDNNLGTWKYVPWQDFTSSSDIDWSQSIADIDKQLYKKYNLTPEEIDFIETHVKEME